jgi:hypothetical protein
MCAWFEAALEPPSQAARRRWFARETAAVAGGDLLFGPR